ncbi:LysR family transcriptional regulator [Raoultella sp. BIGb0138]|uniref:LysR family transcriptional regulator n=1 Tax=Raoultella sp. BIGb0138 TaxID=2485115 RepID=UPI0010430C83|nr:LysR family transcriptional regulator [Raoultella sp. BIGb0138]TCW04022.1 LysR family transcriptional regulator [Raoultella sp. BIGb0138]
MNRISYHELGVFLAIARHKSLRRAADELGCTPSALSHSLRAIEERLNLRLFNRTTRSIALTEAGERLFSRIMPAFRDVDDALEDLNTFRDTPSGQLRITASHAASQMVLIPLVTRFLAVYPGASVEVVVANGFVDMVSEGFDAGVRLGESLAQDMIAIPLGPPIRSAYVASADFFRRHPIPAEPEQLRHLPCIRLRFESGRYYHWEFERDGIRKTIEVPGRLTISAQELAIPAALAGSGIAFTFESQVAQLLKEGKLIRVLEEWCPTYPGHFLYYPGRRQLPATLRAFVDFIKSETP